MRGRTPQHPRRSKGSSAAGPRVSLSTYLSIHVLYVVAEGAGRPQRARRRPPQRALGTYGAQGWSCRSYTSTRGQVQTHRPLTSWFGGARPFALPWSALSALRLHIVSRTLGSALLYLLIKTKATYAPLHATAGVRRVCVAASQPGFLSADEVRLAAGSVGTWALRC